MAGKDGSSVFFHCTPRGNLKSIYEFGLLPKVPGLPRDKPMAVYVSTTPFGWMEYVTKGGAGAQIEIHRNSLDEGNVPTKESHAGDAVSLAGLGNLLDEDYYFRSAINGRCLVVDVSSPWASGSFKRKSIGDAVAEEDKYLAEFYGKAEGVAVQHGYEWEIQTCRDRKPFEGQTIDLFLAEFAWVVINSGMKNQVAEKIFARFMKEQSFDVVRHPLKRKALVEVYGNADRYWSELVSAQDKLTYLDTLPHIGGITKYHLARNLGIDVAKPDRHLVRLSVRFGYLDVQELCKRVSLLVDEKVGVVDVVLWRWCNLTGGL